MNDLEWVWFKILKRGKIGDGRRPR